MNFTPEVVKEYNSFTVPKSVFVLAGGCWWLWADGNISRRTVFVFDQDGSEKELSFDSIEQIEETNP